jgi:arsenite methyltransferase
MKHRAAKPSDEPIKIAKKGQHSTDEVLGDQTRLLYTELVLRPRKDFGWGKGLENARALGYDPIWLERLPYEVWESAAAVGNPFRLGPIQAGATIVDLGCGAGADACVAALLVGAQGWVIGVDFTPAMVAKARANAARAGFPNVEIHEADMAQLPLPDACADVVISNGAINLSPHKPCVLKEALRVLKPGGRLYIADMVREQPTPPAESCVEQPAGSWANCVAGTLSPDCFVQMIVVAGFVEAEFIATTGYSTAPETIGATFRARKSPIPAR